MASACRHIASEPFVAVLTRLGRLRHSSMAFCREKPRTDRTAMHAWTAPCPQQWSPMLVCVTSPAVLPNCEKPWVCGSGYPKP